MIPFYERLSRLIFKICFSRSCSPCRATKQTYGNFTPTEKHFGRPNHWASLRLHTAFIFTSIEPLLLDQWNKTSWVFPALKWTSHFLPQFTVSHRSNSSSEANSSCCHINSSFKLVLKRKTGEEIPEASRLEFFEVFSQQFCFIRGRRQHLWTIEFTDCMTDLLLLRTLSVIHQKSRKPSSGN